MKVPHFLSFIAITAFLLQATCISSASINDKCLINYISSEPHQRTIQFESCSFNSSEIKTWNQCQSICCTLNATIQKGTNQVDDCIKRKNLSKESFEFKYIFVSIVIFVIGLFLLIKGLGCYKRRLEQNHSQIEESREKITKSTQQVHWIQASNTSYQMSNQQINAPRELRKNHICCLCKKCKVNVYSYCGHSFHTECLNNWCSFKRKCPKCFNYKLSQVKIYCTKCYSYFFIVSLQLYLQIGPVYVDCINCFTKQQVENKITKHYWIDPDPSDQS